MDDYDTGLGIGNYDWATDATVSYPENNITIPPCPCPKCKQQMVPLNAEISYDRKLETIGKKGYEAVGVLHTISYACSNCRTSITLIINGELPDKFFPDEFEKVNIESDIKKI